MNPLEREIARQRAELLRIEQNGASAIVSTYQRVEQQLEANLAALTLEIERARAAGIEVRPGWLFAQRRYAYLIHELQQSTLDFLHRSITAITDMQGQAVERVPEYTARLAIKSLGPGPAEAVAQVRNQFGKLPVSSLERLVGNAGDGQPLGVVLTEAAPRAVQAVRDSLAYGVAAGKNPRVIARDVMRSGGIARNRALNIARTETMRAYRTASFMEYRESEVVEQWYWMAYLDERTCPGCMAEDGTVHPVTEELESHPGCRCTPIPWTNSWSSLGFSNVPDTRPSIMGPGERFASLPESTQAAILGEARLKAYNAGEITLSDLVRHTHSDRWGGGMRPATLHELNLAA